MDAAVHQRDIALGLLPRGGKAEPRAAERRRGGAGAEEAAPGINRRHRPSSLRSRPKKPLSCLTCPPMIVSTERMRGMSAVRDGEAVAVEHREVGVVARPRSSRGRPPQMNHLFAAVASHSVSWRVSDPAFADGMSVVHAAQVLAGDRRVEVEPRADHGDVAAVGVPAERDAADRRATGTPGRSRSVPRRASGPSRRGRRRPVAFHWFAEIRRGAPGRARSRQRRFVMPSAKPSVTSWSCAIWRRLTRLRKLLRLSEWSSPRQPARPIATQTRRARRR